MKVAFRFICLTPAHTRTHPHTRYERSHTKHAACQPKNYQHFPHIPNSIFFCDSEPSTPVAPPHTRTHAHTHTHIPSHSLTRRHRCCAGVCGRLCCNLPAFSPPTLRHAVCTVLARACDGRFNGGVSVHPDSDDASSTATGARCPAVLQRRASSARRERGHGGGQPPWAAAGVGIHGGGPSPSPLGRSMTAPCTSKPSACTRARRCSTKAGPAGQDWTWTSPLKCA
jgi:hypothetical protein